MFWNRISGIYDFVENTFNGKVNRINARMQKGGLVIVPTYINESTKTASAAAKFFNILGANFKREFCRESYQDFFKEMGYDASEYYVAEGRMPCCAAIIKK